MSLERLELWLLYFVALYPPVTAAFWIAGGLLFRLYDETNEIDVPPSGGWPGVTVLIPAYNEEQVIEISIRSALTVDYPVVEVLVLDDGSTDATSTTAQLATKGDARARVVRDPINKGKAERLNDGFRRATYDLVIVMDADTHIHPLAPKLLVSRMLQSNLNAAVAGAPHVTNRTNLLCGMQVMEAASIIGLIRRTGALRGRVGTVAGVLGLFRRDAVIGAGGYRAEMATEDIDLTWRLLLNGWQTTFEPQALVGMEVPPRLSALWKQRCRWARGQGEILHQHFPAILRWRNRTMWPLAIESVASLLWVTGWLLALAIALVDLFVPSWDTDLRFGVGVGRRDSNRLHAPSDFCSVHRLSV